MTSRDRVMPWLLLLLVWCATSMLGLGSTSLWEPDEPRFAEATWQMLLRRDFLTPYFNGLPRFEKPILFYWMQVPGFALLGPTETAARLPAALAGLGCLVFTWRIGARLMGPRAALLGALLLATTFRFAVWTRQGLTDVPVLFWILAAIYCFLRALDVDGRPRDALVGWAAVGAAAMTKGPVAILPLAVMGAYLVITKRTRLLTRLRVVPGAIVTLAIVLPWYALMTWRHGQAFLDFAIGHEIVARYGDAASVFSTPSRSVFWYFRIYPGDAAPYSLLVLSALAWSAVRYTRLDRATRDAIVLLVTWGIVVFLIFSTASFKAPHYILPAYPAATLLAGLFLDRVFRSEGEPLWIWRTPLILTALAMCAIGVVVALFLNRVFRAPWAGLDMLVAASLIVASVAMIAFSVRGQGEAACRAMIAGVTICLGTLASHTAPQQLQRYQPIRKLGEDVASLAGPDDRVALYGRLGGPGLIFYGRHDIVWLDSLSDVSTFLGGSDRRFCVLPQADFEAVSRMLPKPLVVLDRGSFFNVSFRRLFEEHPQVDERPMLLVSNRN